MARRKAPALPDAGAPPPELLVFEEAASADEAGDHVFGPGGEFGHPGLLRFRRKSRWRAAQRRWCAAGGLHRYYLLNAMNGRTGT